ncbi:MAG TPA: tRNA pseudouridine(55) synthase TruB [Gemmatimonadales bacterium]|nr:tRNA pseudouridine(55) synthase TruB [Gemmatimonadales bacterium]
MLPVAKPVGPTSHDVVDQVRRVLGIRRVGHLGTLDPFAQGLLVLVIGRATRLAPYAAGWAKTYTGTIRLGTVTDTDDPTGAVLQTSEAWRELDRAAVEGTLRQFTGRIAQRPPAHSAVSVGGERAYRRARRGEAVTLAERPVEIRELALLEFAPPDVRFRAEVGAGTYLRSLARDVGERLGCGAHLAALVRTAAGPFTLADARSPESVTAADVRDAAVLVQDLPRRDLDALQREAVVHGRPLPDQGSGTRDEGRVALFADGELVAVAEREGATLKPRVVVSD